MKLSDMNPMPTTHKILSKSYTHTFSKAMEVALNTFSDTEHIYLISSFSGKVVQAALTFLIKLCIRLP